ncbi:hypothetical protein C9374_002721 [Naegleria lovaniensis]|uniref:Uncharacterized protein n=1 Tax=Naegleria lovaniensis TaxID=51637 RepID=A0AA88KK22_NAELO|nr:uncharacterized protein C9374_002721 [Naegleria lovaniensis]KAG2386275.1 hypothetical protein C9374_002721 [Naegleria lovaniensis]
MNSTQTPSSSDMIILVNTTQYILSSNSIADLTISCVGLFACLCMVLFSWIFSTHYLCHCAMETLRERSKMRKLKKQGNASRSYYESLIPYNGSVKFFETSQPILFVLSSLSILFWYIGTILYYNLIRMHWYGPEEPEQVGSFSTRRLYCIFTYIWFHYIWGSNLWGLILLARLFSLFMYNVRFDLNSRIKMYSKKQYISLLIILLTFSVSVCIGVVHSVFMKFNTTNTTSTNTTTSTSTTVDEYSSFNSMINTPIVCNRLNSISTISDPSIAQYDPNTIALVVSQYLIIGGIVLLWILNCSVYFKQCLCCAWKLHEFPNILYRRAEFYIYLITSIVYMMDVTQFNVISFLYGFHQTSIEDIPLGIRYSNVLAIPLLEIILFFGVNANVLFRFYCICCCGNKEYIRSYRTYEDQQLSCNIVLNTSMRSTTSKLLAASSTNSSSHNMTVNDSSTNISTSGASTARNMTNVMTELDEYFKRPTNTITSIATHNVSSASGDVHIMMSPNSNTNSSSSHSFSTPPSQPILTTHYIPSRNIYVTSPKNNRNSMRSEPLPFHGLENSGKRTSMKSNRSSIRSSSSKKSSDSRVHFLESPKFEK